METIFPVAPGVAAFFLNGHRVVDGVIEGTGTLIVKRSYEVNGTTGALQPSAAPFPIFQSDEMEPDGRVRHEHDLAPFKPEGDLIVRGFVGPAGEQRLRVDGTTRLRRTIAQPATERDLFGWEPRVDSPRATDGAFPTDANAYPLPAPLPAGFGNRFFNGYRRDAREGAALPYLPPRAGVTVERAGSVAFRATLRGERVAARYELYSGQGPDVAARWQPHPLPVVLDTLLLAPEEGRCYAVWRATWRFAAHPAERYRRLVVTFEE